MLFHFLYGKPPPKNFPERSAAGKQWTYKSKGKKAEREKLVNRLALIKEARKRAAATRNHVIFTGLRREERELREALRLMEASTRRRTASTRSCIPGTGSGSSPTCWRR